MLGLCIAEASPGQGAEETAGGGTQARPGQGGDEPAGRDHWADTGNRHQAESREKAGTAAEHRAERGSGAGAVGGIALVMAVLGMDVLGVCVLRIGVLGRGVLGLMRGHASMPVALVVGDDADVAMRHADRLDGIDRAGGGGIIVEKTGDGTGRHGITSLK